MKKFGIWRKIMTILSLLKILLRLKIERLWDYLGLELKEWHAPFLEIVGLKGWKAMVVDFYLLRMLEKQTQF